MVLCESGKPITSITLFQHNMDKLKICSYPQFVRVCGMILLLDAHIKNYDWNDAFFLLRKSLVCNFVCSILI